MLNRELVITYANCITPLGNNGKNTADSIKNRVSKLEFSESLIDSEGNLLKISKIKGIDKNESRHNFLNRVSEQCLKELLKDTQIPSKVYLLMGYPALKRPGIKFDISNLVKQLKLLETEVVAEEFAQGSPSAIYGLEGADSIIKTNPEALCIIGTVDSLLDPLTLDWFEKDQRLNSEGSERVNAFVPSEAVSFIVVESKKLALKNKRTILAQITSLKTSKEPNHYVKGTPSKGQGLTTAVKSVLSHKLIPPESLTNIFFDLNGEFHRAKDWGFIRTRCFDNKKSRFSIWHPADCMGDTGAANAGVLLSIVAQGLKQKWLDKNVLIFSSDDHGACGAVVLSELYES